MNIKRNLLGGFAIAAAFGMLPATQAAAQSIVVNAVPGNWSFVGAAQVQVPGTLTNVFFKPANVRLIATFSAECAVGAPAGNTSAWVDLDIVLLNAAGAVVHTLAPTLGSSDAFCSSNGTAGVDGWATQSVTAYVPFNFPAGNYRAEVRARINAGATTGWISDRTLLISR